MKTQPSPSDMKMMGESDNIGDAGMLGLPGVIILVTWPVQCDLSSQARPGSHTRKRLSRSRITQPAAWPGLVPRYRNNAYSRSWSLPTAGPWAWAYPDAHNPPLSCVFVHFW